MQWWTNTHTYTHSATRRLFQRLVGSKPGFVQLRPERGEKPHGWAWRKSTWSLFTITLIQGPPNHPQTWPTRHQAGISKDWNILGLSSPTYKMRLLRSVVWEDFRIPPGESFDCPESFLNPHSRKSWLSLKLISNRTPNHRWDLSDQGLVLVASCLWREVIWPTPTGSLRITSRLPNMVGLGLGGDVRWFLMGWCSKELRVCRVSGKLISSLTNSRQVVFRRTGHFQFKHVFNYIQLFCFLTPHKCTFNADEEIQF